MTFYSDTGNTATARNSAPGGHGNRDADTPRRWIAIDPATFDDWNLANRRARWEHDRNLAADERQARRG